MESFRNFLFQKITTITQVIKKLNKIIIAQTLKSICSYLSILQSLFITYESFNQATSNWKEEVSYKNWYSEQLLTYQNTTLLRGPTNQFFINDIKCIFHTLRFLPMFPIFVWLPNVFSL